MKRTYPNFLIVGLMKAGTTTLYDLITLHPKVVRAREKELHYFSRDYNVIIPDYIWSLEYREMLNYNPGSFKLHGEASPSYISVPERIFNFNSDCKILIILRDPVEKIISQYRHYRTRGLESREPKDIFSNHVENNYIADIDYWPNIMRFIKLFGEKNVSLISLEYLSSSPIECMNDVFNFLSLERIDIQEVHANKGNYSDCHFDDTILNYLRKIISRRKMNSHDVLTKTNPVLIPNNKDIFLNY